MKVLGELSPSWAVTLLPSVSLAPNNWLNDPYSVLNVEAVHQFELGIFKKLKGCTVSYVSSRELEANPPLLKKYNKKSLRFARAEYWTHQTICYVLKNDFLGDWTIDQFLDAASDIDAGHLF